MYTRKKLYDAFSLIEMLIVMSVIGLLLALASPDLFSLVQSNSLSAEGSALRNRLTQAQQSALSLNADVEVRFFKFSDSFDADTVDAFRGYQFFKYNREGQMIPLSQLYRIKSPVAVDESLSTIIDVNAGGGNTLSPDVGDYEIPIGGDMVSSEYVSFRYRPDGSTDLPNKANGTDVWYITLVQGGGGGAVTTGNVPNNFFCVQLDPFNGRITEFRP